MWALTLKEDGVCAACGHNFVVDNIHRNNVIRVCEGCGSNEFEWAWFW
jgi:predicted  nucleic acid-binding Zn-ribbon protein